MTTKFLKNLPKSSWKIIKESPKCPSHVLNGPNKATKIPQKFHFRYITDILTHSDPLNTIQIYASHCQNISNSIQTFQTLSIYFTHFPKFTDTFQRFQTLSLVPVYFHMDILLDKNCKFPSRWICLFVFMENLFSTSCFLFNPAFSLQTTFDLMTCI